LPLLARTQTWPSDHDPSSTAIGTVGQECCTDRPAWPVAARAANPNGEGLPRWPLFKGGPTVMLWDTPAAGVYNPSRYHQYEVWRQLYPQDLSGASPTQPGATVRA
jgi:hypothetical protein